MSEQWDGYPENPERDGWHWVLIYEDQEGQPAPFQWSAEFQCYWGHDDHPPVFPKMIRYPQYGYFGPCLTPTEVEARVAAARREGIEAAAKVAGNWNIPSVDKPAAIRALLKEGER